MNRQKKIMRNANGNIVTGGSDFASSFEEMVAKSFINCGRTRQAMFYKCQDCGNIILVWLERGLGEHNGTFHKPVPFGISCPACNGFHMYHEMWDEDIRLNMDIKIPYESYYFANLKNCDCGRLRKREV